MKINTLVALGFFCLSLLVYSCKKYEDGPLVSFRSKKERISNDWKTQFAFRDGVDVTEDFDDVDYRFDKDGFLEVKSYNKNDSLIHIQQGFWHLVNSNETLSLTFTEPMVSPDRASWDILRLKENELWIKYLNEDQQKIEVRYISAGE